MEDDYTGVTQSNHTLADLFDNVSVQLKAVNGTQKPVFVLHTSLFDEALELLQAFPINLMPVSIEALRLAVGRGNLPLDDYQPPQDSDLTIELSVDDFDPYHILYSVPIPRDLHQQIADANIASKDFVIVLQEQKTGVFGKSRVELIRRQYAPYTLDWWGILGYTFTLRRTVSTDRGIDNLINLLMTRLEENGPATGIFTEMGYLYRMFENWEKTIEWYEEEVRFNLKPNRKPGIGAIRALSNLGVIHKKLGDFSKARDYFTLALSLNPNYFESLLSIGGIIDDPQTMLTCVTRAYRIRPRYPIFIEIFEGLGQRFKRSPEEVARKIEMESLKVNLLKPSSGLKLDDSDKIIGRLGL